MRHALLYMLTAPNGRSYIGVTCRRVSQRFGNHARADTAVGRAIRKHGKRAFSRRVLVVGDEMYLYAIEDAVIRIFGTGRPGGYNVKEGGAAGCHTVESREKIAAWHRGRKMPQEVRDKISAANMGISRGGRGYARTSEVREKNAAANRGCAATRGTMGMTFSQEVRDHMAAAHIGKRHAPETIVAMKVAAIARWAQLRLAAVEGAVQ